MTAKELNQMIFDTTRGEHEYLLIDLHLGTGDIHTYIRSSFKMKGETTVSHAKNVALIRHMQGVALYLNKNITLPDLSISQRVEK